MEPYISATNGVYRPPSQPGRDVSNDTGTSDIPDNGSNGEPSPKKRKVDASELCYDTCEMSRDVGKKFIGKLYIYCVYYLIHINQHVDYMHIRRLWVFFFNRL